MTEGKRYLDIFELYFVAQLSECIFFFQLILKINFIVGKVIEFMRVGVFLLVLQCHVDGMILTPITH